MKDFIQKREEELLKIGRENDWDFTHSTDDIPQDIKSFHRQSLLMLIEKIEEKIKKYPTTRGVDQSSSYQIGQNHGRQEMGRVLIDWLSEEKGKIK